jgi:hypothetical protein
MKKFLSLVAITVFMLGAQAQETKPAHKCKEKKENCCKKKCSAKSKKSCGVSK